jgi:hypothetical protein
MHIANDGKVGIGRSPITWALELEGDACKTSGGAMWFVCSDRRIKTDIEDIEGALDTLGRLRLASFRYTDDYLAKYPNTEDKTYYNVIAQEYAEVFPDYVHASGDGGILQVDTYPALIHAVAAVQELHRMVDEKDARIASLEEQVAAAQATAQAAQQLAQANDERIARLESALAALSIARR